uniref:Uncharacterized protein n=1 Tax=Rhizophora mucronata TaxID=61149 RepID=A0A2P2NTZ3_RHIMU
MHLRRFNYFCLFLLCLTLLLPVLLNMYVQIFLLV